ncbi:hypothetical protein GE21DRAFT_6060 [Neurospora crassa]|uniref:F-box domain-containing protein n=2 Tax=Neurospora crassa TaxID=5141 RepID=Q7RWB5_NEUCR|nr:hypothetical protein NCU04451 [Neurospora crassa OR74A]EAA26673.2 hypothetical protein NCU04451 [Neurospora crassa OR74A]KHE88605.1 hypothetical protein GE21DRAFT_6060 [Neurospora crassa]CAF05995.1 hypothetical protein [Neurospora crassa]|eukprot:XP_955909.2 hypothetical protein NCU04451 [Neurospora crassa OR74A]
MPLLMARLASSPTSPNNYSLRTPMIQRGAENNLIVSTPSQGTGQNQQTSTSSQTQASLPPSNSMASRDPALASSGVQDHIVLKAEPDIPTPASTTLQQDNVLSGVGQPMVDQPLLVIPNTVGHMVFQPLPVVPVGMGPMFFEEGCPCPGCRQWIAQQRQQINDLTRHVDGLEASIRPAGPPAIHSTKKVLITNLPSEILNMIVSYVMGGVHEWHYSPPKFPLSAQMEGQQQDQPDGHAYAHAQHEGKRCAGSLTDEKLHGLSQTCKRFRDLCVAFGAHDYLQIWTEFDEFLKDDFTRLSEANRNSGIISRVKHLIISPPPNGRAYVSRPNTWKGWGEAGRLDCVRTVIAGMDNLVSLEIYSSKKYDTLRNAFKNRTLPTVRSITLDSLAPPMGTLIRSCPNLRVLRSRSTGVWDRPDNEVFKSLQNSQFIETACFLGTRGIRTSRQHRTPQYAVKSLSQLRHLFWEFSEPHCQAEDANMIEALRAHNNIRKFTMLRHASRPPPDFSQVYDDDTTIANLYFNRIPHLEEIGICRAKDRYGYGHADSGKVFVRIKKQVEAVKPAAEEDGNGSNNKGEEEKNIKNDKIDKTVMSSTPETITLERRKVLRIYNYRQSDEHRIKQLELGHVPRTPDRHPSPGIARDPEYSMFELEWRWARHQTLKEMYEREAAESQAVSAAVAEIKASATRAAKASAAAKKVKTPVAEVMAAAGIPHVPLVEGIPAVATVSGSISSTSSVPGGIPAAAAHHGIAVPPSIFGSAAAVANLRPNEAASQSIDNATSSSNSSSFT